jgi:hypothetical protein
MKQEDHPSQAQQRLRREDPVRTEAIRNWSTLYRRPHSWGFRTPVTDPQETDRTENARSQNGVVSHGVELGYQVVDEHIRQGQRVAHQLNGRPPTAGAMEDDIRGLVERLVRYYGDLGALWGDLLNSLATNPDFLDTLLRPWQPHAAPSTVNRGADDGTLSTSTRGPIAVGIEIISSCPTQVILDLHPQSEKLPLGTHGLSAVDPKKPPLTDIAFEPGFDHGAIRLRVRVPDGQPPDTYTGVIVDKRTNQPRGTLSVRVGA